MNQIYAIDSTRISHREYWWGSKSPLVLIGWLTKWLRIRLPSSTDDPNFESTMPWVVESLPDDVMARFQPLGAELAALGFYDVAYHCFRDPGTQTTIYWATFLHSSGTHFARIHHRLWSKSQKVSRASYPVFFTEFNDGTFLVSSSGKPDMVTPASVQMNWMQNTPATKLWDAHQQLAVNLSAQRAPVRIASAEEALAATERHHILLRDFHIARGVFRPRNVDEESNAASFAKSVADAQASGFQYPEVMAELERLQQNKPSWVKTLWLLPLTILLFVFIGAKQWDWKFTLWLIPVLLFHEAGHWITMRIFGYRNLRMFFIPMFGAAVSGRHWNVAGWKKAIVSLAGPVPGIALGCVLAIVALIVKKPWVNELALILLIVNGFNLLPVLPLDGGHVLHVTLFCRNRWLDIVFRFLAIAGLVLLSFGGSKFMFYIAIPLAIGLPLAFKQGKVVDQLRNAPLPPPPLDSDRIPTETAHAIIGALKTEQPKGVNNKMLAQQTIAVYETLNAKPPNVGATIGLLAVHAGAFFFSLIFLLLLVVGKLGGGFGNVLDAAARQPQHDIDLHQTIPQWKGDEASSEAVRNLIIATFDRRADAIEVYSNFTRRLPATASMSRFGDSLLVSLPVGDDTARERHFNLLQSHTTNTFVVVSNHPATMSLFFIAPGATAASNLVQELLAYSAVPGANLVPPWSPVSQSQTYTNYLEARKAWLRLNRDSYSAWNTPAVSALNKKITAATRRGATAEVEKLTGERDALIKKLQAERVEKIRTKLAGTPAAALADLHIELDRLSYTNRAERKAVMRKITAILGEAAHEGDQASVQARAIGGHISSARSAGLFVEVPWCRFSDPQTALPLVLDWLREQHCAGVKYDFHEDFYFGDLEESDEGDN